MNVKQLAVVVLVVCCWASSAAAAPVLTSYDAKSFTLSVPKGWTVVADASKGMVVAQQDPKRKDAAQLLVIVSTGGGSTDDQLLDMMLKSIASAKVIKRESLPNGVGKLLIAEGTSDGIKVRLGAIAASSSSGAIVGLLISKVDEFDALGGTATVGAVLASIKLPGATTTAPPAPTSGSKETMTPTYDAYNNLIVPPPQRAITQADLVGEWKNTGKSIKGYVNTSTRGYAGYSAVVADKAWSIDAKGNLRQMYNGVHVSNAGGGTFQVNGDAIGTLTIASDRVITVAKGDAPQYFLLRGWFVGPELTVMRITGPFYDVKDISDDIRSDKVGGNLDEMWVRKTR